MRKVLTKIKMKFLLGIMKLYKVMINHIEFIKNKRNKKKTLQRKIKIKKTVRTKRRPKICNPHKLMYKINKIKMKILIQKQNIEAIYLNLTQTMKNF